MRFLPENLRDPLLASDSVAPQWLRYLPAIAGVAGTLVLLLWLVRGPDKTLTLRRPGTDAPPGASATALTNAVLAGQLVVGSGQPATDLPGSWSRFRGDNLVGLLTDPGPLARSWDPAGPRELWSIDLGEGYAGAAVLNGRVYVMDYSRESKQDALRCLSFADGKEIWRYAYPVSVKRNHGMSRTVPTVTDTHLVAMGPKCHVVCLNSENGELRWGMDLVRTYGAKVPPWYAGQCPLIEDDRVILAPGGNDVLMTSLTLKAGETVWETPNPNGWKMTHVSITPIEFAGKRIYVYCANRGVVGVDASDGQLLWETTDWKISIATVPSPVDLGEGKLFFSGGYNAGSLMMQLKEEEGTITPETLFRLPPETFGATQQTPILHRGHLFGVRPDGKLVCLKTNGEVAWDSGSGARFGLGPFLLAGDLLYVVDDRGVLTLAEASVSGYSQLAQAKVLDGRESWGPLALASGRLIARDLTRMVCLDVSGGN